MLVNTYWLEIQVGITMNFLDFFDEDEYTEDTGQQVICVADAPEPNLVPAGAGEAVEASVSAAGDSKLVEVGGPAPANPKVGRKRLYYSRGSAKDRSAWNLDMQLRKAEHRAIRSESQALTLLANLSKKSVPEATFKLSRTKRGALCTRNGLIKIMRCQFKTKGNRFGTKWGMDDFLRASFGCDSAKGKRIYQRNSQALASNMSGPTVAYMRAVVCGAIMARQSNMLARVFLMCRQNPPLAAGLREAWDETGQVVVVDGQKGNWQIIVVKHFLLLTWPPADSANEPTMICIPIVTCLIETKRHYWFTLLLGLSLKFSAAMLNIASTKWSSLTMSYKSNLVTCLGRFQLSTEDLFGEPLWDNAKFTAALFHDIPYLHYLCLCCFHLYVALLLFLGIH